MRAPVREPAEQRFLSALQALGDSLRENGAPWLVIGGVAVIAAGVPRLTADIDATVLALGIDPEALLDLLRNHRIVPRISDAVTFAKERQVLLVQHEPSGVPVDLSLAWLPFEEEAIRCGVEGDYAGVRIRLPRPEDLIIYKFVAARPRDLEDAERLLLLYGASLDISRIRRIVREFAEALEDVARVQALERLLCNTGLGPP
jgi:hypothetical protein